MLHAINFLAKVSLKFAADTLFAQARGRGVDAMVDKAEEAYAVNKQRKEIVNTGLDEGKECTNGALLRKT